MMERPKEEVAIVDVGLTRLLITTVLALSWPALKEADVIDEKVMILDAEL